MQRSLEFQITIDQPVPIVYAHLADPANFLGLQPLLTSMSSIQEAIVDRRRVCRYETVETFRLGSIPLLHNRIQVETTLTEVDRRIDTRVRSFPNIALQVSYDFVAEGQNTLLTERMEITVARWLAGFVVRQATQAQQQTLANLKARLEADHRPPTNTETAANGIV
jgi:hypothetical protein